MFYEPLKRGNAAIVIVDGYGIGDFFLSKLLELGYKCIHVQSSSRIPNMYVDAFYPQNFIANLIYSADNLQNIIAGLKKYAPLCVIAGSEPGVECADLLSEKLGLFTNGTKLSEARRDKFKMIEVLKHHKLNDMEHIKSNILERILAWAINISWFYEETSG